MKQTFKKPELLLPAGNLEKLKIACIYGADAVYIGGQKFGLRSGADNFSNEEIAEGCQFAKNYDCKVYVVLNAFLHNKDYDGIIPYVKFLEEAGVSALIISDAGVITTVSKACYIPIHLSTQASCLNSETAKVWKKLGVTRIITGRELSVAEGGLIKKEADIEVEMFIHGAMCSAYSGHCSISNYTAGRDSNRGGCKQSCRFHYHIDNSEDVIPLMSSKDLNGVALIDHFFKHEIDSVKVEGRMKSNLYVAATCKAYRNIIDEYYENRTVSTQTLENASKDLSLYPNRDYTEASLLEPANADSIVKEINAPKNKYAYAGTVIKSTNEHNWVQLRNPVSQNDTLTIISKQGNNKKINLEHLYNFKMQPIQKARQDQVICIKLEKELDTGMVLCKANA